MRGAWRAWDGVLVVAAAVAWVGALLLLGACTHVTQAEPEWLMRYAEAGLEEAPLGRLDQVEDLTWTVLGLELVDAEERARWVGAVGRGLRGWEGIRAVPVGLRYVHDDPAADVRVQLDNGLWADGLLALGWPPASDYPGLVQIRYDEFGRDIWHTGYALIGTPHLAPSRMMHRPSPSSLGVTYTAMHEMGHVMGLPHLASPYALMAEGGSRRPALDVTDVVALVAIYWDGARAWRRELESDRWGRWPR